MPPDMKAGKGKRKKPHHTAPVAHGIAVLACARLWSERRMASKGAHGIAVRSLSRVVYRVIEGSHDRLEVSHGDDIVPSYRTPRFENRVASGNI